MLPSQEVQLTIAECRQKVIAGTATQEELKYAINLMRAKRGQAAEAAPAKSRTKAAPVNSTALLDELDGLS